MDKQIAKDNLIDFTRVLTANNIRWFLTFGTCLGAYREGDFIGHDKDMDVGILEEEFNYSLLNDLSDAGFEIRFIFGMRFHGMEIAFYRNGVKIDLMLFYKRGNKRFNVLWQNGTRNGFDDALVLLYPEELFNEFCELPIGDENFFAPAPPEEYIKCIYGESWKTQDPKWKWWESPHNITKEFKL